MNPQIKDVYKDFSKKLGRNAVLIDDLSLIAYGADASCYRKIPQIVLKPGSEQEVVYILGKLLSKRIPVTFRAAGTSLSGQSISDSVLLQARGDHWNRTEVIKGGVTNQWGSI